MSLAREGSDRSVVYFISLQRNEDEEYETVSKKSNHTIFPFSYSLLNDKFWIFG